MLRNNLNEVVCLSAALQIKHSSRKTQRGCIACVHYLDGVNIIHRHDDLTCQRNRLTVIVISMKVGKPTNIIIVIEFLERHELVIAGHRGHIRL